MASRRNQSSPPQSKPRTQVEKIDKTDAKEVAEASVESPSIKLEPELSKAIRGEVRALVARESYSGPMPKPDHLEQYDRIVPGAAKDILEEFKANGAHMRSIELKALGGAIENDKRGQWMAFFLVVAGFFLIAYLAVHGAEKAAMVVAGTLLVAVITGFLAKRFIASGENGKDDAPKE